jgi:hypothetical protein
MPATHKKEDEEQRLLSERLPVDQFRQILWLPLRTRGSLNIGHADAPSRPHWVRMQGDPLRAADLGGPLTRDDAYAQFLYFHPYVRRFLFEKQEPAVDGDSRLRIWTLAGLGEPKHRFAYLDIAIPVGQDRINLASCPIGNLQLVRLKVERCRLYQFPGADAQGTLMLEVELSWKCSQRLPVADQERGPLKPWASTPLMLADVLDLLDMLRRTHPPYFPLSSDDPNSALHLGGGRYPIAAAWRDGDQPLACLDVSKAALEARKQRLQAHVMDRPTASVNTQSLPDDSPLDTHWAELLGPAFAGNSITQQIEDERMPLMAYVSMPSPHLITDADWKRLAFCDYRGNSQRPPHAADFGSDFKQRHCYDRHFEPPVWNQRITNTGYAFVMVGPSTPRSDLRKNFFESDALIHFRRHYASMGLLAQYNKAALLCLSNRLNEAIETRPRSGRGSDAAYRADVRQVLADLLEFTHRFRFEGVSNQLQACELYEYWVRHLGLKALHQSVMDEARAAHEFIVTQEEADQTAAVKKLTTLGLWFAVLGALLGLAGAGFPIDKPLSLWLDPNLSFCSLAGPNCVWSWRRFFTVVCCLVPIGVAAYVVVNRLLHRSRD